MFLAFNYYEPESINVIGIDWDALAPISNYLSSAYYSNAVGQYVGEKIVVNMLISVSVAHTDFKGMTEMSRLMRTKRKIHDLIFITKLEPWTLVKPFEFMVTSREWVWSLYFDICS